MNIKSLKTQFIGAIAMVLVAAIAMGSSTYAWFAMNTSVRATGLEVRTSTGDNLLIASGTTAATAKPADNLFQTSLVLTHDEELLEPVSSINGVNFFYTSTKNVAANGDAIADIYTAYNAADTSAFNTNYKTTGAVGYIDYAFFLKANNADTASSKEVNITELKLTYGGSTETQKAFRAAVFVNDMGENGSTAATAPAAGILKTILKKSDAGYHTATAQAVTSTSALAETLSVNTAAKIGDVAAGKSHYFKVVVRLWLEGEDTSCTNDTFANLKDLWALDIKCEIGGTVVSALNQVETTAKVDLSAGPSSAAAAGYTIDNVGYYPITGNTDYYLTSASTAVASNSTIYKIVDGLPVDVTNQCTLPTT